MLANVLLCRINEMENRIGAGLIEEVIQVAEGELKLLDTMLESKMYVLCRQTLHSSISSSALGITLTLDTDGRS